jgi:hypothetical protein
MIALILNFFMPMSSTLNLFVFATGMGLFFYSVKKNPDSLQKNIPNIKWGFGFFLLLALLVFKAFRTMIWTDVGNYPLPLIRWHHDFALPFGLVNLHNYYGVNSLLFNIGSVLWLPLGDLTSVFSVNILIFVFFIWAAILKLKEKSQKISSLFALMLLLSFLFLPSFLFANLSSPHTDFPGAILTFFVFYLGLRTLETNDAGEARSALLLAIPLAVGSMMIKLSTAPIILVPLALLARRTHHKFVGRYVLTTMLMLLPFVTAGLMTSGCLAFPKGCFFDLPWATSPERAQNFGYWVTAWARYSGSPPEHETAWGWIPAWWHRMLALEQIPLVLAQASLASLVVLFARFKNRSDTWPTRERSAWVWIFFTALLGVVFWFVMAPDPRFGAGFILTVGALFVVRAIFSAGFSKTIAKKTSALLMIGLLGLFIQTLLPHPSDNKWVHIRQLWEEWPELPIGDDGWEIHKTKQGEPIYGSVGNGTPEGGACWNLPQPCVSGDILDLDLKVHRLTSGRLLFVGGHKK